MNDAYTNLLETVGVEPSLFVESQDWDMMEQAVLAWLTTLPALMEYRGTFGVALTLLTLCKVIYTAGYRRGREISEMPAFMVQGPHGDLGREGDA